MVWACGGAPHAPASGPEREPAPELPWPSQSVHVSKARYRLFAEHGETRPLCKDGEARAEELGALGRALSPMQPHPAELAAVTFGKLEIELSSGERVVIRPVFNQGKYDVVKVDRDSGPQDAVSSPELTRLLKQWQHELSGDASRELVDCASGEPVAPRVD